jgi:hypothetical protein
MVIPADFKLSMPAVEAWLRDGPMQRVRFMRFVYGPGDVTAHVVPVTLCDSGMGGVGRAVG